MKSFLHKIVSFTMALLVLLSTMSFSVDMHFCGSHLVDFSLFSEADACVMKMPDTDSMASEGCAVMKMNCCSDVEITVDGQDDLKTAVDQLSIEQQTFIVAYVYTYINLFEEVGKNNIPLKQYIPPPLIRDVQVLDQTFLI